MRFAKELRQGVPYKAENWCDILHEQYFSKHRSLDICRCACKYDTQNMMLLFSNTLKEKFFSLA